MHEPGWAPTDQDTFAQLLRRGLGIVVIALVGAGISGVIWGGATGWGVALGVLLGGIAMSFTLVVMIVTGKLGVQGELVPMLGAYLLKMMLVLMVLGILAQYSFYSKPAFLVGFVGVVVAHLILDMFTIARTRA